MEQLKEQSKQLANKQSHVRKSFQKWLDRFADATDIVLNDENLEYLAVGGFTEQPRGTNQLLLRRGTNTLYYISSFDFQHVHSVENALYESVQTEVDIEECDMQFIRSALKNIPAALNQHIEDMQEAEKKFDELLKLIQ